jgi:hypothetical protein
MPATIRSYKVTHHHNPVFAEDGRKAWTTTLTITLEGGMRRQVRVAGKYAGKRALALAERMWTQHPVIWGEVR